MLHTETRHSRTLLSRVGHPLLGYPASSRSQGQYQGLRILARTRPATCNEAHPSACKVDKEGAYRRWIYIASATSVPSVIVP